MKSLMKILTVAAVAVALALTGLPAYAGPVWAKEDAYGGGKKGAHFQDLMDKLDLTEEQRETLTAQREENWKKMKELREAMNENRQALREELLKDDYSKAAVKKTVSEMKDVQGEMIEQRVDHFLQMKEVLTPEQYRKFTELAEKKHQKAKKGRYEEKRHRR
jgi:Spy/CpxP family protein refolding chaperone